MNTETKFKPEFVAQGEKLARLGATDTEMGDFFGVDRRTITRWKSQHEEFGKALVVGKHEADERVQSALYHRAIGYEIDDVKIFMPAGAHEPTIVPYRRVVDPDTTAQIFWLKNRRSKEWRDKQETEITGDFTLSLADSISRARKRLER